MAAFDLLGRRWAILVLWELRDNPVGFRDLRRALNDVSSSVLSTRLRELSEVELVATTDDGKYVLTSIGKELLYALSPLKLWSFNWAQHLGVERTDDHLPG